MFVFIEGQKRKTQGKTNQSRAFQEVGVKVIFYLLSAPENIQNSYRKIAQDVGVSIGSVSNVMAELKELNYWISAKSGRVLKNRKELLEKWLDGYNTVLNPRILRSRMRFVSQKIVSEWRELTLKGQLEGSVWGGEPAGAIISGNLKPREFIIYSNNELTEIGKNLLLIPDEGGNVEIRHKFWNDENDNAILAPALLVYADLINSGYGRNIEIAKKIFEYELQSIK